MYTVEYTMYTAKIYHIHCIGLIFRDLSMSFGPMPRVEEIRETVETFGRLETWYKSPYMFGIAWY